MRAISALVVAGLMPVAALAASPRSHSLLPAPPESYILQIATKPAVKVTPASRDAMIAEINTNLPTNGTGSISAQALRTTLIDLLGGVTCYAGDISCAMLTYTGPGTGGVTLTGQAKWQQTISAADYGVKCDGSTNDTANMQKAWNYTALVGLDLNIGGIGTGHCEIPQGLVAPQGTAVFSGNRSGIVGGGAAVTFLETNANVCAVTIAPSNYGVNSDWLTTFKGFQILQTGSVQGSGLCLTDFTDGRFQDIMFRGFANGVIGTGTIRQEFTHCWFYGNTVGVHALSDANTRPNAWMFINPVVAFNTQYGMVFQNPTQIWFEGGDWEGNGVGGTNPITLYIAGNPLDGSQGLSMHGGYFSANSGVADVYIDDAAASVNGVHSIVGAEFQRNSATLYPTASIFVNNSGAGNMTTLHIAGNSFAPFGAYPVSGARPVIAATAPTAANLQIQSDGNWFANATEYPTALQSRMIELPWATYTPTMSCGSGTVTSATPVGTWKRVGFKSILLNLSVTITTHGTCAGAITLSLPTGITAGHLTAAGGQDAALNFAAAGHSSAGATTFTFSKYDGTTLSADGAVPTFNFPMEVL